MDPLIIVSPHLDDAVLSCGQLMAGYPGVTVVTMFTGLPIERPRMLTSYDANCGFASAAQARLARLDEDRAAMEILDSRAIHVSFVDGQYEPDRAPGLVNVMADRLVNLFDFVFAGGEGDQVVIGPMGIAHPDHHLTAEAFRIAIRERPNVQPWVYEDMPNRVLLPDDVPPRVKWWKLVAGYDPVLGFLGTGDLSTKEAAIRCYQSQLWALDIHACLVPERHWRLWP